MNILIIEDQSPTMKYIENTVKKYYQDANVISVTNTKNIDSILLESKIDLTITDLDFDGNKRFEALEKCYNLKIPCIVYSGHYNISFVEKAMKYCPRAFICKLSEITEFEYAIKNYKTLTKYQCSFITKNNSHNIEIKEPILSLIHEKILLQTLIGLPRKVIAKQHGKKINTINSYVKEMVEINNCTLIELIHRYSNWKKVKK